MKRFRLSTLMLLVVIAALGVGMVVQEMRHRRREAELQTKLSMQELIETNAQMAWEKEIKEYQSKGIKSSGPSVGK